MTSAMGIAVAGVTGLWRENEPIELAGVTRTRLAGKDRNSKNDHEDHSSISRLAPTPTRVRRSSGCASAWRCWR